MPEPLITTVIPTFRRPKPLRRAIESVLAQSFKDFKICVHDNASGDETEEVVADYIRRDSRVFYFKNNQNIGAAKNMIQGVNAIDTPFYSLLNDDDFLLQDFYENAMREFKNYPQAGFVCAKTITVDLINQKVQFRNKDWLPGVYEPSNEITSKMYFSHFTQTGVLMKRSMNPLIGAFEASGDDRLYMTMAAASSPFAVVNNYGGVFIQHERSYSEIRIKDIPALYGDLLSTVDSITKIHLPEERKVYLLMLAINSYHELFDKMQSQLMTKQHKDNGAGIITFPSRITIHGLVVKLYEILPGGLHPVMTRSFNLLRHIRKAGLKKFAADWLKLPKDANSFLLRLDTDVSKFVSYLRVREMANNLLK